MTSYKLTIGLAQGQSTNEASSQSFVFAWILFRNCKFVKLLGQKILILFFQHWTKLELLNESLEEGQSSIKNLGPILQNLQRSRLKLQVSQNSLGSIFIFSFSSNYISWETIPPVSQVIKYLSD